MLDKKYKFQEKELKWLKYWQNEKIYEFEENDKELFSIDTPPPTVSGNIHIGHIFSYTQAEIIARYKRLRGYNVFYPFGFDNNGLPTERLVEKEIGKKAEEIGREAFNKLCYETSNKYEKDFENLFQRVGVSADWSDVYKTIAPSTIKISQLSFLDLVKNKKCYHQEAPALWCNECLTSIAQAELETKSVDSNFNYINFKTEDKDVFTIATTRPELLPAIVAVFINPNDKKNKHLIGKEAIIPLIDINVPILADENVEMDKGTGIVMCCTFGDQTDIQWWKQYNLPLKNILTDDGKIIDDIPSYGGLNIYKARKQIIEDLQNLGAIVKIDPLNHEVQTHERCGKQIEYKVSKQWFIDIMNHKNDFIKMGQEIKWYPSYMRSRYEDWVENIMWDWGISRQRYFGVPFPVWYCKSCGEIILATEEQLPVNPLTDKPTTKCICGSEEFVPEADVMDTWATSSLTPMINMKYGQKENYEDILKPMSLRVNAHDIIRTWDFYTIVKSYFHFGSKPWENVMVSGFGLSSSGDKISKSKNNSSFSPIELIEKYSADGIRYWSATSRLGTDSTFTDQTILRGKKLINKIWNVSKFIEFHIQDYKDEEFNDFEYIDKWILAKYQEMEKSFLKYLDEYEVGLALNVLEKFFWNFCDNYIEIVKHRLYRPEEFGDIPRYSGQKTCYMILYKLLQKFSIYFPFITEEIFQELYQNEKSIHITNIEKMNYKFEDEKINGDLIIEIISHVRGEKTINNVSLKTPVSELNIGLNSELKDGINKSIKDIKATLFIDDLKIKDIKESYEIYNINLKIEDDK